MLPAQAKSHLSLVDRALRIPSSPVLPARILDSWRRSYEEHHLDPGCLQGPRVLTQAQLREHRQRAEDLLHVAAGELDRLHARVRDAGYCLMLADAAGRTIDYRVDTRLREDCRVAGLHLGTCWSEHEEGTCGVAAVLTEQVAVTVHKHDHFRAAFTTLTCSAAPIFDLRGRLLGVLDISAPRSPDGRHSQLLIQQLVCDSARAIEDAFFSHSVRGHWVMRAHAQADYVDNRPDYLLAWDTDGQLLGANRLAREHWLRHCAAASIGDLFDERELHRLARGAQGLVAPLQRRQDGRELYARLSAPPMPRRLDAGAGAPGPERALDARVAADLALAIRVQQRNLPILVSGETGSGKEVFARAVHTGGDRRHKPFVALNCAALPESLIESELFGYAPGAFTGARAKGQRGLLLEADGGTLFLDEIGDMPLNLQTRLLRVLAEGEVRAVGATRGERVDLRLICATHRDLEQRIAQGEFREDLYYRLAGARFHLPPLRERGDRVALIKRVLEEEARSAGLDAPELAPAALEALLACPWPGNVRQLRNVLRYACAVCPCALVDIDHLPVDIAGSPERDAGGTVDSPQRRQLLEALVRGRWKPVATARLLGISRATLYRRLRQYGIPTPGRGIDPQ
ncbi:Transcriptional regulator of acetoin/glycerol metabolism [Pseudomonas flavescens]|uniref:Transcriptional regulator of acetoin/glycerol metabolism n=1 Tax=Phytopseudomonas flavescens TaxID=29435 RepID=A0A1G8JHL0_9GAMM|nr:sigma-54-dependent Fis family transcriptional regulator [Pseudomonas flavescens]SDI30759.1 Transcriptional regulator of acetoin/glycerol metabolism [Pseudomonas flavescens]